jgi:hypothetical protein
VDWYNLFQKILEFLISGHPTVPQMEIYKRVSRILPKRQGNVPKSLTLQPIRVEDHAIAVKNQSFQAQEVL